MTGQRSEAMHGGSMVGGRRYLELRVLWLVAATVLACATATPSAVNTPGPPEPQAAVRPYRLQRGDRIEIKIFGQSELDGDAIVRPDGHISVALLDDVRAAGRTSGELTAYLAGAYSQHFADPEVAVVVREFANHNVYVGGEVVIPGLLQLRHRMTSVKAIVLAGGFRDTAQLTNLIVLRDAGGHPEIMKLNAKEILDGSASDLILQPFDIVFVPKSKIARVNLFVEQYIKGLLPMNLSSNVSYAYIDGNQPTPTSSLPFQ